MADARDPLERQMDRAADQRKLDRIAALETALAASRAEAEALRGNLRTARVDAMVEAAAIAEARDRSGREWVRDSLWDRMRRETAEDIRRACRTLKEAGR